MTLKTYNRRLEQTLFALGVSFLSCEKDDEGMTYWVYRNDEKTSQIFRWFREATESRRKAGW